MLRIQFPFLTDSEKFSLAPYEEKDFQITLNKDQFKSLFAGFTHYPQK